MAQHIAQAQGRNAIVPNKSSATLDTCSANASIISAQGNQNYLSQNQQLMLAAMQENHVKS